MTHQIRSAPQGDLTFKAALTNSSGAHGSTPRVRLTTSDISSNLHKPGALTKLLNKVNGSNEKRNKRGSACLRCRTHKKRCDGCFPCGLCLVAGETCRKEQGEVTTEGRDKRVHERSRSPATLVNSGSSFQEQLSIDVVPSATAGASSETGQDMVALTTISPENPLSFPDDPFQAWSPVVPSVGTSNPWPQTLVFMFKSVRSADHFLERVMNTMTPKLRSTVLHVFRAIDTLFQMSANSERVSTLPEAPTEWAVGSIWQHSARCGWQAIRYDRNFRICSGVQVNKFWSDLSGLHREEFISRSVAGDALSPTSELRQFCKLLSMFKLTIETRLESKATGNTADVSSGPTYMRFSRDWGRHDRGEGVLVRMNINSMMDPQKDWYYMTCTLVEVTAEEYEAARGRDPRVCEGYMIPVVGSKSAAQLLDPRLAEEESFAHLSAHPEGRVSLDRFADYIEKEFAFVFAALAKLSAQTPPK